MYQCILPHTSRFAVLNPDAKYVVHNVPVFPSQQRLPVLFMHHTVVQAPFWCVTSDVVGFTSLGPIATMAAIQKRRAETAEM